jgi:hypothetical protein
MHKISNFLQPNPINPKLKSYSMLIFDDRWRQFYSTLKNLYL